MAVQCILTGQTPRVLDGVSRNVQVQLEEKQNKITANGLLKGDGNGNITAATEIVLDVNINLSSLDSGFLPTQVTCNYTQDQILSAYKAGTLINCNIHANSNDYPAIFCLQNGMPAFIFQQLDIKSTGDMPALIHTTYVLVMYPDSWALTDVQPNILKVQRISNQNILKCTFKKLLAHVTSTCDIVAIEYNSNIYFLSYYGTDAIKFSAIDVDNIPNFMQQQQIIFTPSNVTADNNYVIAGIHTYTSTSDPSFFTYTKSQDDTYVHVLSLSDNVKNKLNGTVNPKLLDNWYFGNPVNQRGKTTYRGAGYGIDRWKAEAVTPNVTTIKDGYIELSQNALISQLLEEPYSLCGKQVTVSALTTTGLYSATATVPSKEELSAITTDETIGVSYFAVNGNSTGYVCLQHSKEHTTKVMLRAYSGYTVGVIAVKLELGPQQTLAHQENGVWVLNEIPDYNLELLKCQRYFQIINSPYNVTTGQGVAIGWANNSVDFWVNFTLSVPMRTSPTLSIPDITLFKVGKTNSNQKDITKAIGGWATRTDNSCNMRSIIFTSSGLTTGDNYTLFMMQNAQIMCSAEL